MADLFIKLSDVVADCINTGTVKVLAIFSVSGRLACDFVLLVHLDGPAD